jgi:hypothetical protein
MKLFREFEKQVLRLLVTPQLGADAVEAIERDAELVNFDHSGVGYFLTVSHPRITTGRVVCNKPMITGRFHSTLCGFIVFIENGELTLECYAFGDDTVPKDIRDLEIVVSVT